MAAREYPGIYCNGKIELSGDIALPEGTRVVIRTVEEEPWDKEARAQLGKVIIAGFGLAGRWVADIFDRHGISYTIVEKNPATVEVQTDLGNEIIEGDVGEEETLLRAGIREASILALTVPDEDAVLRATAVAKRLKPEIYVVARTTYSSKGLEASQLGADAVIKAEQAVARQFYEMLQSKLRTEQEEDGAP
jgi:Trk K+ transport system NAD-binding subunit